MASSLASASCSAVTLPRGTIMIVVDLSFPVSGAVIPEDNGYPLYAAISRALGSHLRDGVAIASSGGPRLGDWRLRVTPETRLRIRTPADRIGDVLPLAGRFL